MKINLDSPVLTYEGKEAQDQEGRPLKLRTLFVEALNGVLPEEILTAEQKNKIFQISIKLQGSEVELTLDDRAFIKERAGKILTPLAFGRVTEVLEEKETESEVQTQGL